MPDAPRASTRSHLARLAVGAAASYQRGVRGHVVVVGAEWESATVFTVAALGHAAAHRVAMLVRGMGGEVVAITERVVLQPAEGDAVVVCVATLMPSGSQRVVMVDGGEEVTCGRVRTEALKRFAHAVTSARRDSLKARTGHALVRAPRAAAKTKP